MLVRRATLDDIPALIKLGEALHAESPRYCGLTFSRVKLADLAVRLLNGATPGGIIVAETDGTLIGMFCFILSEMFFGFDKVAYDLTVYVAPAHRGSSAFSRMTQAAEDAAQGMGAQHFQVGVSTGIHAAATARVYGRMGYTDAGVMLSKEL